MKCKMVARALYDYEAQDPEELTIKEGGIILITNDTDQDWWEGVLRSLDAFAESKKGLVPLTYVEEATPLCIVKALYDYDAAEEEEISIREGDIVRIYEKVDSDWWFGKVDHDVGLIPATYVEEIEGAGPAAIPSPVKEVLPDAPIAAEQQKNMLMNALGGFGFDVKKTEPKPVTGVIYGPDEATYYPVVEIDKKKKKYNTKGLLGVSQIDKAIFFVTEGGTKEIINSYPIEKIIKYNGKKKNLTLYLDNDDTIEYEGDKKDIEALSVHIETALRSKNTSSKVASPALAAVKSPTPVQSIPPPITAASPVSATSAPKIAIALYDYTPAEEGELQIYENDMLIVLDSSDPDWWMVKHLKKHGEGLVPMTYIELQVPGVVAGNQQEEERKRQEEQKRIQQEEQKRIQQEDQMRRALQEDEERKRRAAEDQKRQEEARQRQFQDEQRRKQEEIAERQRRAQLEDDDRKRRVQASSIPVPPPVPPAPPAMPQIPQRPQMTQQEVKSATPQSVSPATPQIPQRPKISESPNIPSRPPAIQSPPNSTPSLPSRPPATVTANQPIKPVIATRPALPATRPKVESSPKEKAVNLPDQGKIREWKDKSGKFSVHAAYVGLSDNKVQLHKMNGVIIGVPLDKLDQTSLDFLRAIPGNENLAATTSRPQIPPQPLFRPSAGAGESKVKNNSEFSINGFDWKDWLMKAGIASSDATVYAQKFIQQRFDYTILADIDRDALRAMGITEGDIIRIRKAASLPPMNTSTRAKANQIEASAQAKNLELIQGKANARLKESQISADEAFARQLQEEENARNSTVATGNIVNPATIFEAGNLLQAANSSTGSSRQSVSVNFNKPPSTQEVNTSQSLGLNGASNSKSAAFSNDPWGGSQQQDALLKAKQEETQKNLETARMAIQKANEQARQAAVLEEQAKAAKMSQQSDLALLQAQETAKQALLIQQQAAQKLMAAQMEASKPSFPTQTNFGFNQQTSFQQAPRPLSNPLIPTPSGAPLNNFIPVGQQPMRPMQSMPLQAAQPGIQTLVTPNGVQKPNWNSATPNQPFGNTSSDPYAAFKEAAPNAPSIFNSPVPMQPQGTGTSVSSYQSSISNSMQQQQQQPSLQSSGGGYQMSQQNQQQMNNFAARPMGFYNSPSMPSNQLQMQGMNNQFQAQGMQGMTMGMNTMNLNNTANTMNPQMMARPMNNTTMQGGGYQNSQMFPMTSQSGQGFQNQMFTPQQGMGMQMQPGMSGMPMQGMQMQPGMQGMSGGMQMQPGMQQMQQPGMQQMQGMQGMQGFPQQKQQGYK